MPLSRSLRPRQSFSAAVAAVALCTGAVAAEVPAPMTYDFGGTSASDAIPVAPGQTFSAYAGYGFEGGAELPVLQINTTDGPVTAVGGGEPFFFSAALPEHAYHVTVRLVGARGGSNVTIKAESRRSMLGHVQVPEGEIVEKTFAVWPLTPRLPVGEIRLTDREIGILGYDDKLTLEFNGTRPAVASVTIAPAEDVTNVFLAGDSTVTDQPNEPWSAWGAMLPMYFDEHVAVANLASSGRALRSFRAEGRLDKILSLMQPGDYVFIQFGHNDQKEKGEGIGPFQSYTRDLEQYVEAIRAKGGKPALVTSMVRRRFDEDGKWYDTLGDYPEAVRRVAADKEVPLIDLFNMSRQIVEALGVEKSKDMFVHYPANTFPGQGEALKDDTHFNAYGGDLLARAVIRGMKQAVPDLAKHLRDPETGIDPQHPEAIDSFNWPASPPPTAPPPTAPPPSNVAAPAGN